MSASIQLPSNKASAQWVARLVVLLIVFVSFGVGFYKISQRQPPSAFRVAESSAGNSGEPIFQSRFASSKLHVQTHAASLVELKDGRIHAFWFSGSREGAPDVEIHSAVFDPSQGQWSAERSVTGRETTQRGLLRFVRKVGNPVAARAADGTLKLFYVTVSVGGWAGSSITAMGSVDEGETWSAPRRLITSPFLNVSTLVKGTPFVYADGTMGLPVYHEFISKFGELLRLNAEGAVIDKQRLAPGGAGTLQPVMLVQDARDARVLMRHSGPPPHRAASIATQDAGGHWSSPENSALLNPDSALTAIVLPDGRMLAALNNLEQGRDALSLMISIDGGANWKTVYQLEDQLGAKTDEKNYLDTVDALLKRSDKKIAAASAAEANEYLSSVRQQSCAPSACGYEFSYPYLIRAKNGDFHLAYTWNRTFIKHVQFNQAWLDRRLKEAP